MFKLFKYTNGTKAEVLPINDLYTVKELGEYEFVYEGQIHNKFQDLVFVEDIAIDTKWYKVLDHKLISYTNKYFENYFGPATLKINNITINLNIQIEKLRLSEIEDILIYLWQKDNNVFYNFFSKSTLSSRIDNDGSEFGLTSKFIIFANHFHSTFSELFQYFKKTPHTVLRKKNVVVDYNSQSVTSNTIEWILDNLDNVNFDESLRDYPDSIRIGHNYGYIDKIGTEVGFISYDIYENQIILGAFINIISKLRRLKSEIRININEEQYGDDYNYDFRDLKKIPFIRLLDDSDDIERKLSSLLLKYNSLFEDVHPRNETPKLSSIFSHKYHYRIAYKIIKESSDLKFNFNGELQLLNIKKLSTLYEIYNLHIIINSISEVLNLELFDKQTVSNREDNINNKISFLAKNCTINIYYELKIQDKNLETELVRIDTQSREYYEPDFVIEIKKQEDTKYYILDSKYTKYYTLKGKHLPGCIFKYILNVGIRHNRYRKPESLVLLYPGDYAEDYIRHENYSPQIILLPSKPKYEGFLDDYMKSIIKKDVPAYLQRGN